MENKNTSQSKVFSAKVIVMLLAALVFAVLGSLDSFRSSLTQLILPEQKVLAKINFSIADKVFTAYKFLKRNAVLLEIYEHTADNQNKLLQSIIFKGDRNALLQVKDVPVSLGVSEAKETGELELFSPTLDENGNSRLNSFRYDPELNQFIQINVDDL